MKNYQNYSMDDIIFENRNKAYGAYQLRQISGKNTAYGLLATTSAIVVFILITSLMPNSGSAVLRNPVDVLPVDLNVQVFRPKTPVVRPPKTVKKAATMPQRTFTTIQPVDTPPETATMPVKQEDLLTAMVSTVNNNNISINATVSNETVKSGIESSGTTATAEIPEKQKIERWVEVMPSFVGGNEALLKYLKKNITMDSRDIAEGISGKVTIQFYIDIDGSIKDAKVIKDSAGGRCAERALAVINKMPKWNPGRQGDKAVRVYHTIPITFEVN